MKMCKEKVTKKSLKISKFKFFFINKSEKMKICFFCPKKTILLVLPFKEICICPEFYSLPCFRFHGEYPERDKEAAAVEAGLYFRFLILDSLLVFSRPGRSQGLLYKHLRH